jgi:flagellar biosynthesis/type III secretory pathway protein FliH
MTTAEKLIQEGMQRGMQQAMQQGIELLIAILEKFNHTPEALKTASKLKYIHNADAITKLMEQLETCRSIKEFEKIIMLYS